MKLKRHNAESVVIRVEHGMIVVYAPGDDPIVLGSESTLYHLMSKVTRSRYE
jgi:CRISPR/Cas system-associated protein Cas10 (large subunit of type III CRISPR-Cas system)